MFIALYASVSRLGRSFSLTPVQYGPLHIFPLNADIVKIVASLLRLWAVLCGFDCFEGYSNVGASDILSIYGSLCSKFVNYINLFSLWLFSLMIYWFFGCFRYLFTDLFISCWFCYSMHSIYFFSVFL
jgi:hypothetical protein